MAINFWFLHISIYVFRYVYLYLFMNIYIINESNEVKVIFFEFIFEVFLKNLYILINNYMFRYIVIKNNKIINGIG